MDRGPFLLDGADWVRLSRARSTAERSSFPAVPILNNTRQKVAVNKPVGDTARKGQEADPAEEALGGLTAWTKRNEESGEFMG